MSACSVFSFHSAMNFSIFPAFSSPLGIWDWESLCVLVLTFHTVLFQMVLVPLWLERKHLPTAFPSNFPSGRGTSVLSSTGSTGVPAQCPEGTSSWKLHKLHCLKELLFCFLQVYRGEVFLWVWTGESCSGCSHADSNQGIHDINYPAGASSETGPSVTAEAVVLHPAHHEDPGDSGFTG